MTSAWSRWCSVLVLAGSVACGTIKSAPPTPPRQTKLDLGINQFELKNGMRVAIVTDMNAAEVTVTTRYDVGAVDDPAGKEGLAHLAEHLMFEQEYEGSTLYERLDRVASYHNAYTWLDSTVYETRVAPEDLDEVFTVEGARLALRCQGLSDEVFARERAVVENERKERAISNGIAAALGRAAFGAGHPYDRLIGGTQGSVAALTKADVCAFVDAHYAPGNAIVVVSGPISPEEVDAALGKLLGRVPQRNVFAGKPVPATTLAAGQVEIAAPVEDEFAVIAWTLPADAGLRARMRAVADLMVDRINFHAKGVAYLGTLGGDEASALAIFVEPADDETLAAALGAAERGISGLLQWLEEGHFEGARQAAIHQVFARLEDGSGRDGQIADHLAADRPPGATVGAELKAITSLDRDGVFSIARQHLRWTTARRIVVKPAAAAEAAKGSASDGAIHLARAHRLVADPALADKPADVFTKLNPLRQAQVRRLGNGIEVVLMPSSSTPTVDVRVVFAAGYGDEPQGRRGVALLTAHGLDWSGSDGKHVLNLRAAGGRVNYDVGLDHTSFEVTGMGMHLDYYLTGLERLIRNGRFGSLGIDAAAESVRRAVKAERDPVRNRLVDAYLAARYGKDHPYARASVRRHFDFGQLGADELSDFRDAHYRPDAMTIIIAGGFDAALADRWIDHLFADCGGKAAARADGPLAQPTPAAFALADETSHQLAIDMVWSVAPRRSGLAIDRVAAEMLAAFLDDVRAQLGATYGVQAEVTERRLDRAITLAGQIDARRAGEALALIRRRLDQLAAGGPDLAAAFVAARQRVLADLRAVRTGASALAASATYDAALEREVDTDVALAAEVGALTLDQMTTLGALVPGRAVVLAVGPKAALDAAARALGLTWATP